ncbi:MAG: hypothetical protein KF681_09090 [Bdellovibrionaceae bacterium]|nr:hypothetical protein [Pseudobdellovibrionaceae bacterium]
MKTLMKILVPSLMIASSAQAELAWVKGPFWQAPIEKNISIKLVTKHKDLAKTCKTYRELILNASGKVDLDATEVDYARTESEGFLGGKFAVVFTVDAEASQTVNAANLTRANSSLRSLQTPDPLPYYTQPVDEIAPTFIVRGDVEVLSGQGSLTGVSKSLGLKQTKTFFTGEGYQTSIKVYGRDLACDLLLGQAALQFESGAKVKIALENQLKIDEFYRGLETTTVSIFAKKKSATGRAALFGFRAVDALSSLRLSPEQTEVMIGNLVEHLFDANMQRNSQWKSLGSQYSIPVYGTIDAVVNVRGEK